MSTNVSRLHERALLVKLTIRKFDGFKKDKTASGRIDEDFKTAGNVGSYNKRLFNKGVLDSVNGILNELYSEHARMTVPWAYDGIGLLPSSKFMEYTEMLREKKEKAEQAIDILCQQLPVHMANQMSRLGDLYRAEEYPTAEELREKYEVSCKFFNVPQEGHYIVNMEAEYVDKLKQELRDSMISSQRKSLHALYKRVLKSTEHIHERLSNPKNVFHDSLIENLEQLVQDLPELNIFADPLLVEATQELRDQVLIASADQLRSDFALRQTVADNALIVSAKLHKALEESHG